jgi:hypothetical protein
MPGCSIEREVIGGAARYRVGGKFEGACAWDLAHRIENEPLRELTLDFSQCGEFVDYGVAVLASALLQLSDKCIHLEGLRQHQLRLFKYFGVDADQIDHRHQHVPPFDDDAPLASEVA